MGSCPVRAHTCTHACAPVCMHVCVCVCANVYVSVRPSICGHAWHVHVLCVCACSCLCICVVCVCACACGVCVCVCLCMCCEHVCVHACFHVCILFRGTQQNSPPTPNKKQNQKAQRSCVYNYWCQHPLASLRCISLPSQSVQFTHCPHFASRSLFLLQPQQLTHFFFDPETKIHFLHCDCAWKISTKNKTESSTSCK